MVILEVTSGKKETVRLWSKVILACLPAAVIGLLFNDYMEKHFMTAPVVSFTLILYGILFIVVENYNKHRRPRISDLSRLDYKTAFIIGVFQVLSLVPGTSRSGATILGGILLAPAVMWRRSLLFSGHSGYVWCESVENG